MIDLAQIVELFPFIRHHADREREKRKLRHHTPTVFDHNRTSLSIFFRVKAGDFRIESLDDPLADFVGLIIGTDEYKVVSSDMSHKIFIRRKLLDRRENHAGRE